MAAGEVDGRGDRIAAQKEHRIASGLNCRAEREKRHDDTEAVRHLGM